MPNNTRKNSYLRGCWAEQTALEFLLHEKLKLLERNFRSVFGEIDLIMQDKNIICFIEVRYRSDNYFHTALESIDKNKCDRIIVTSQQYLAQNRTASHLDCRFDVVVLSGPQENSTIKWIKNAFQA